MDIRCGSCNKLFRVADEKVSGKGIRFKCSRCGEVITVTRDDAAASAPAPAKAPEAAPAPPKASPPQAQPASPAVAAPAPQAPQFEAQEYQPPAPSADMGGFDFSEPHEAALHAGKQDDSHGSDAFTFDSHPAAESGGELTLSEEEEKEAEAAFQFPADIISEPTRKPPFLSRPASDEDDNPPIPDAAVAGNEVPDLGIPHGSAGEREEESASSLHVPSEEPSVAAPSAPAEEEIDLGRALAIPSGGGSEEEHPKASAPSPKKAEPVSRKAGGAGRAMEPVHPLTSGNVTGAVSGVGCGLPVALLVLFGFSMMAKVMPLLSGFPVLHLVAVVGTGIFGMSVMTGIVVAVVQAQAGKKLFFLVNVMIAGMFGVLYGAGMNAMTAVASGASLRPAALVGGAISGGALALLLGLMIVIARRLFFNARQESFGAPVSGLQKSGIVISFVVILLSLYAQGTLIGSMERSVQEVKQGLEEGVTPDGLSVRNAQGYVDQATGDLIITGTVQNGLDRPKSSWYVEVNVYDQQQKVLATIRMLNGVQLFEQRDFDILTKRGKNTDELKAGMIMAFQQGEIPSKGSVDFEMHLMDPPRGIASFYPVLKGYSSRDAERDSADH